MKIETHEVQSDVEAEKRKVLYIRTEGLPLRSVTDVKNARKELEQAISALIADFESRSRCSVTAIEARNPVGSASAFWRVEVRL